MKGRRILGYGPLCDPEPGDYWFVERDGHRVLMVVAPNGLMGDCSRHDVTEHEDGTVTVSPSIFAQGGPGMANEWHGWLERGVWRSV